MAKTSTTFRPGQSGNPNGRPTKKRALTEILERAGAATVLVDGKKITGKHLVARLLWQAATTATVQFPDSVPMGVALEDWIAIVKFIYTQVDGPPKSEMDITSDGGPIVFKVVYGTDDPAT